MRLPVSAAPFWLVPLLACASTQPLAVRRPPNVVVIVIDDLGWTDLGCYGSDYHETPHIDRLAAHGVRFTQAYAAAAVCSPTRAAIQTGCDPARLGITDWIRARFQGGTMPDDGRNPSGFWRPAGERLLVPRNPLWLEREEVTIAEVLRSAGYRTAHVGKWHLGLDDWYPEHQGYDLNRGGCDLGHPPSYFDPYENEPQGPIPTLAPRREGEYLTDREADEAVEFIRENAEGPFFLHLAPYAVHTPLMARADLREHYERRRKGEHQQNAVYAAMVRSVDDALGRVLAALEDLEVREDTLVIFTSDNGGLVGPTSNHPLRAGKGHPYEGGLRVPLIVSYEGGLRVPLIVSWPRRVPQGAVSDVPVTSVDLMPTICDATGIPRTAGRELDGVSLYHHLRSGGSDPLNRESLFWHFPHYRREIPPYSVARIGDLKLVKWWEGPTFELYDLADDPSETRDLASERPDAAAALDARLTAYLRAIGARIPRLEAPVDRSALLSSRPPNPR
jgi:arylsulfatase A-like enzyme